jgi:hypothetical protein
MNIELREITPPSFCISTDLPTIPPTEYRQRLAALYTAAQADWIVVYGDREHYANLTYLINFDPRFEEALLLLGPGEQTMLVVGNEDMGYAGVLPFPIEMRLAQSLSLPGQQRDSAPRLGDVLAGAGIRQGQTVKVVGWKYLEAFETDTPTAPAFIPAFIVDLLRALVGQSGQISDGTALLMHPENGLRAVNSAAQIAVFEWAARSCSAAVFGVLHGARPGINEWEAMRLCQYSGAPFNMHPIFTSGSGEINGLRSASARTLRYGDAVSVALGYWGSLVCRNGMLLGQVDESYLARVAAPYFKALATWHQSMHIGVSGGEIFEQVSAAFAGSGMRSALNPGHLGSYEEWLHSPIRPGSPEKLRSGMVFQSDIIPTPLRPGELINCEDTIALADASLRAEIQTTYPEMWSRIQTRRSFMANLLGIKLHEDVLPLTDGTAYLPPFWLLPNLVFGVK